MGQNSDMPFKCDLWCIVATSRAAEEAGVQN